MGEKIMYSGGMILSGDEMSVLPEASLVVEDGRILHIGEPVPGIRSVDMQGKLLCPMFINAHIHLGDTGAKDMGIGLALDEVVTPPHGLKHRFLAEVDEEEFGAMLQHGLREMLSNGIIAFADFREQGAKGVKALRKAAQGLPVRAVILGRMTEGRTPQETESECREILAEADGLGVRDVDAYDILLLKKLREEYPQKIFAVHSSEDKTAERAFCKRTGKGQTARNLDWNPDFMVHLVHTPPEELKAMAQHGVRGVCCARANGILGDGLPDLAEWQRQGVSFGLGTDNVMFSSIDMMREMDYVSRLTRGLHENSAAIDSHSILQAATIEGARLLKLEEDLGSLSVGKEASFIVFDLTRLNLKYTHDVINALVHRACTADIDDILVGGVSVRQKSG